MLSDQKEKLLYEYDKPIIWNISCFGNLILMDLLDIILKDLEIFGYNHPISTVHGSFSSKYNGGRQALFFESRTNIENKIKSYNKRNIGVKMTFSNMHINKDTFEEEEMRWYLDILNETKGIGNGIICVNDEFAELVKKNYPDLDLVASHVKMELETEMGKTDTVDYYNSKFDLYDIVVMNTYRAFDDDFLSQITHPEKVEFIVNHACTTNCLMAKYHHSLIDRITEISVENNHDIRKIEKNREYLDIKKKINDVLDKCKHIKSERHYDLIRKQFINKEEINHLLNTHNINRFKVEGRDLAGIEFIISLSRVMLNNSSMFDIMYREFEHNSNVYSKILNI